MFAQLNDRLEKWHEARLLEEKWKYHLHSLEADRVERQKQAECWLNDVQTRCEEMCNLTGYSLTHLFYAYLGKEEERRDPKRRAAVAAKLKYDSALLAVSEIEKRMGECRELLAQPQELEREQKRLETCKNQWIAQSSSDCAALLSELERMVIMRIAAKEMERTAVSGQSVLFSLHQAEESLQSAHNWGTWQMDEGSIISTMIKHGRINETKGHVYEAQKKMRVFLRELADVSRMTDWQPQTDGLEGFVEDMFECMIADWMNQGNLVITGERLEKQKGLVRQLVVELRERGRLLDEECLQLKEQYIRHFEQVGAAN